MLQCCVCLSVVVCDVMYCAKWCVLEKKLLWAAYRKSYTVNRLVYQNEWPCPLFRCRLTSCQPLRHIRYWISRKPLEIEAWFHATTRRVEWSRSDAITWPRKVTCDPNTPRAQYLKNSWRCYLAKIANLLWASVYAVDYPSDSLASCWNWHLLSPRPLKYVEGHLTLRSRKLYRAKGCQR